MQIAAVSAYYIYSCVSVGIYLTVTMSLTSLSISMTVYVLHLHHAGPSASDRRRVPPWMRRHCIGRLGRALGVRHATAVRASTSAVDHAASPCSAAANSHVDPDDVNDGHLPLVVRPVRGEVVENAVSLPTGRPTDVHDDLGLITARQLRHYLDRHRADQDLEDVMSEWRLLALIFDRLLFWLFLIGIALSTIFILLIVPLTKPESRQSPSHQPQHCQSL